MRWRVLTALILIGFVVTGGLFCRSKVTQTCRQVEQLLQQQRNQPDQEALTQALALWDEALPLLSTLMHHQRLEEVGHGLSCGLGALRAGDTGSCIMQIDGVLYLLDDIREYDHIHWKTLF